MACKLVNADRTDQPSCEAYSQLPLTPLDGTCSNRKGVVPLVYHSISGRTVPFNVLQTKLANPEYRTNFHDDDTAIPYLRKQCGALVSDAFQCFTASAYRADLFRFCALFSEGGVLGRRLGSLTLPELYLPCENASVGHDMPQGGRPGCR